MSESIVQPYMPFEPHERVKPLLVAHGKPYKNLEVRFTTSLFKKLVDDGLVREIWNDRVYLNEIQVCYEDLCEKIWPKAVINEILSSHPEAVKENGVVVINEVMWNEAIEKFQKSLMEKWKKKKEEEEERKLYETCKELMKDEIEKLKNEIKYLEGEVRDIDHKRYELEEKLEELQSKYGDLMEFIKEKGLVREFVEWVKKAREEGIEEEILEEYGFVEEEEDP